MAEPCVHCGALPSGELLGFPVIMHERDCPNAPQGFKVGEVAAFIAKTPPLMKYMCLGCGIQWDDPGEADYAHAPDCPNNPLRN